MMEERILPFHNYHRRATDVPREEPKAEEQPPPVKEVILLALFHCKCEDCARKFRVSIRDLNGVEEVTTDLGSGMVVVKGDKLDPAKVLETAQSNNIGRVDLVSPLPQPPPEEPRLPEIRHEIPALRVVYGDFHCLSCADKVCLRIKLLKGIDDAKLDEDTYEVTVKGVFSPEDLADFVRREAETNFKIVKVCLEEDALKEEKRLAEIEREKKRRERGSNSGSRAPACEHERLPRIPDTNSYPYSYDPYHPPRTCRDENPNQCCIM